MGDSDQSDNPPHRVYLSAFWVSRTVVTVEQYLKDLRDGDRGAATARLQPELVRTRPPDRQRKLERRAGLLGWAVSSFPRKRSGRSAPAGPMAASTRGATRSTAVRRGVASSGLETRAARAPRRGSGKRRTIYATWPETCGSGAATPTTLTIGSPAQPGQRTR